MNFTTIAIRSRGFTIVELLIVVVVIGVLASIVIFAYASATTRAQNSKIDEDLAQLKKAMTLATTIRGTALGLVTGNYATAWECENLPSGTDLAALDHNTDPCWTDYKATLAALSAASGMNLPLLTDPWGRPYYIDENEGEWGPPNQCERDQIGSYDRPFVYYAWAPEHEIRLPNVTPGC